MTNLVARDRTRNILCSNGGNDDNTGFTDNVAKRTIQNAILAVINENPLLSDPVTLSELGGTRYAEGTVTLPDNGRYFMPASSFSGQLNLAENAKVTLYSMLTTGVGNETAISSNGKSRSGIDVIGAIAVGLNDIAHHITGASSDNFCNIGQLSCWNNNNKLLLIDATGSPKTLNYNEMTSGVEFLGFQANNTIFVEANFTSTKTQVVNYGSMTVELGGTGHIGFNILQGTVLAFGADIDLPNDDIAIISAIGKLNVHGAQAIGDLTNILGGSLSVDFDEMTGNTLSNGITKLEVDQYIGNIDVTGGRSLITFDEMTGNITGDNDARIAVDMQIHTGNITYSNASLVTGSRYQAVTGDIILNNGTHYFDTQQHIGDITVNDGNVDLDIGAIFNNLTCNGGTTLVDIDLIGGDFTVEAGAVVTGTIQKLTGVFNIDPAGIFNGTIEGSNYGDRYTAGLMVKRWNFTDESDTVPNTKAFSSGTPAVYTMLNDGSGASDYNLLITGQGEFDVVNNWFDVSSLDPNSVLTIRARMQGLTGDTKTAMLIRLIPDSSTPSTYIDLFTSNINIESGFEFNQELTIFDGGIDAIQIGAVTDKNETLEIFDAFINVDDIKEQ